MKFKIKILFALIFCMYFVSANNCDICKCTKGVFLYNCSCFKQMDNNCIQQDISNLFNIVYNKIEEIIIRDISITLEFIKNLTKIKKITLNSCNIHIIDKKLFYNMDRMTELTIENNKIEIFSDDAFGHLENLHYLNLRNNSLQKLPDKILKNLTKLLYFNLENNEIDEISPNLFTDNKQLERIYLNKNKIVHIPNNIFKDLTHLNEINLSDNKIEELLDDTVSNLPQLKKIYLQNNNITSIKISTFKNNQQLKEIYLDGNKIQNFEWNLILHLTQLQYINIPDGSINCDCKARQFIKSYKEHKISGDIQCNNTKKISNMTLEEFACAPKILKCIGEKDKNSTKLSCLVSGDPLPKTIWRFNGTEVSNNPLYNLKLEYVSGDIIWSHLTILKNFINSSGYEIEARNIGGYTNYNHHLNVLPEPDDIISHQSYSSNGWILVVGCCAAVLCAIAAGFIVYRRIKGHRHSLVETKKNVNDLDEVVPTKPVTKLRYIPTNEQEKTVLEKFGLLEVIEDSDKDNWRSSIGSNDSEHI